MAKESFFEIKSDLKYIQEYLLNDYVIHFDEMYDEITLKFMEHLIWMYGYTENDNQNLFINIKYESETSNDVILLFENKLLSLGFNYRFF